MGARPSSFKKGGGGFLNGVDGVISDYQFTDEFNGVPFKAGKDPKSGKERFHSLNVLLSVRVDGATEDVTTTLFAGGADDFEVEDDGHTIVPVEDGRELRANTAWGKFIISLVASGFPEAMLPEDAINYEPIIGTRSRFEQVVNVEDTKKLGKKKDLKTGKEYDRKDLLITQVYDLAKPATKSNGKAASPAKGKAAKAATVDVSELAGATIIAILQANGGSIPKNRVHLKVLTSPVLKATPEQRKPVQEWLLDEDNLKTLADEGVIVWNAKAQTIEAAAE